MTTPIDTKVIEEAAEVLGSGGLVAYPTDTVYGLAALPGDHAAVQNLFAVKRRDPGQSTPLLIASPRDLMLVTDDVPQVAMDLIRDFWPGGLTIVLKKSPKFFSRAVTGATIGVRVPDHVVPRELVRLLGSAITGTSANVAGGPEPLTADDVRTQLGDNVEMIIDGGPCPGGTPSTVVDCTVAPPRILRAGAITREELIRAAGTAIE
jgi:L-threonylcarbamoyladenylate synthase